MSPTLPATPLTLARTLIQPITLRSAGARSSAPPATDSTWDPAPPEHDHQFLYPGLDRHLHHRSKGTIVNSSILVGTNTPAPGCGLPLGRKSSVIFHVVERRHRRSLAPGFIIDTNNAGSIYLSTNTILAGSQYGIYIATLKRQHHKFTSRRTRSFDGQLRRTAPTAST